MTPEFHRPIALDTIGEGARTLSIVANPEECAALAERFGLAALEALSSAVTIQIAEGGVMMTGTLEAQLRQRCVATMADVPAIISDRFVLRFVADTETGQPVPEIEIDVMDCDVMSHDGKSIDAGEALAQTLVLSLDPFPRAPDADAILKAAGVKREEDVATGAFADLKSLLGGDFKQDAIKAKRNTK